MKKKLIPLRPNDRVEVMDKSMSASQKGKVVASYKKKAKILFTDGHEKIVHRGYVIKKI